MFRLPSSSTWAPIVILVFGLVAGGYGTYDYQQQAGKIDDAVTVNATVTDTNIRTVSQRRGRVDYEPQVTFEYQYRGESYTGNDIHPATVSRDYDSESKAESVLAAYDVNSTVTAYVPPNAPGDAFLEAEKSNEPLKFAGIGVLCVLVAGGSLLRRRGSG